MLFSDLTNIKTSPAANDYMLGADVALSGKNFKMTYNDHASWIFELSGTLTNKTINAANNSITGLADSNIAIGAAIDASKIANGTISNAEFQYLNGLTENIQTQLNGKAATSHNHDSTYAAIGHEHSATDIGNGDVDNDELSTLEGNSENIANAFKVFRLKQFGVISLPSYTDNEDGTISIEPDGVYVFNTMADGSGDNYKVNDLARIVIDDIDDGQVGYVYADGVNDILAWTTDPLAFENDATKVYIYRIVRDGDYFHVLDYDSYALALPEKLLFKDVALRGFERLSGLILSTATNRISTVTAGSVFFATVRNVLAQNIAGTTGDIYSFGHSSGAWVKSAVLTAYDNQYYDDGTNTLTLGTSKWVAKYFYREVSATRNNVYYTHGNQQNSALDAFNETRPTPPDFIRATSIYIGKIVIQYNATNGTAYPRQWDASLIAPVSSGGGLVYFTEAETLYNSQYNYSLTPNTTQTNGNIVLKPKGNGAITAAIPNGTTTGGNNRGVYAVDFQMTRNNTAQVASGQNSGIFVGKNGTCSGTNGAVVAGDTNNVSGTNAVIPGGYNNTASGQNSMAFGNACSASATGSMAFGLGSSSAFAYSIATGYYGRTNRPYDFAHGVADALGKHQYERTIARITTTNATPTEALINANTDITIPSNSAYGFMVEIVGTTSTYSNMCYFSRRGAIANNAGTTALVGSIQTIGTDIVAAALSGVAVSITANDASDKLVVTVTGLAATTISWTVTIHWTNSIV